MADMGAIDSAMQHITAQFILTSTYQRVLPATITIDDYLNEYRSELRDMLREISVSCPHLTATWLVTCASDSLREYLTHQQNHEVVEVLLHALTAVTKHLVQHSNNQVINEFMVLLMHQAVVSSRELCRLAVVIYGELLPKLSSNNNTQQVLLNLIYSVKHSEVAVNSVPFRVKQDHIGVVTITKVAQIGYYITSNPTDLSTIHSLYRDILTPLSIESLYNHLTGMNTLLDILYAATLYTCSYASNITWKSSKIMLTGFVTALSGNYRHEYTRITEYYRCLLPFFIASARYHGVTPPVLHTYLVSRVGAVPLTPAEIGIIMEVGEDMRRDGICEVIDALVPCWKCDGTLTATLASDLLIPWLQLIIDSVVNGNCDRAVTLAELGKIIIAFTKLVTYNENLVITDGSR